MQVDRENPKLTAPGTTRLKLEYDVLSSFAFNFNWRRYNTAKHNRETPLHVAAGNGHTAVVRALLGAGAAVDAARQGGAG